MKRMILAAIVCAGCFAACTGTKSNEKTREIPQPTPEPSVAKQPYQGGFTKEQRLSDAMTIVSILERNYAPRAWKQESLGISFEERSQEFLRAAAEPISDQDFYALIGSYLAGFQDAHISFTFPSTALAKLPFETDDVDGHIVLTGIDDEDPRMQGISPGDELISIDGRPATSVRDELFPFISNANARSRARLGASFLTFRPQAIFPFLPEGPTLLTFQRASDGHELSVELQWTRIGEEFGALNDPGIELAAQHMESDGNALSTLSALESARMRRFPMEKHLPKGLMGNPTPFFPLGADFIERHEGAASFFTGVFDVEGKRIGLLRIPSFGSLNLPRQQVQRWLLDEISFFEETTDALIIDQTGNPGGNYCWALTIASFFFDKPFPEIQDRWRANRTLLTSMEEALEWGPEEDKPLLFEIVSGIRQSMRFGQVLTDPFPECSVDGMIKPQPVSYTKPILLLADELSVSCGDYFPALMQDTGRATIFGARTMGGGGTVQRLYPRIGYAEFIFSYTVSLGVRAQGPNDGDDAEYRYIENVGVTPDIPYHITLEDFRSGYAGYLDAVMQSALSLIDLEEEAAASER